MQYASKRELGLQWESGTERRASARFPLTLDVRYTVSGRRGNDETGSGRTVDLSSSGLSFIADGPLSVGQRLDLAIDWPALLDGGVQLQLIMSGIVVRTNGTLTALRIRRHEFKTRRIGPKVVPSQKSG
jgi:c-di-GMP-binding flagellar brake protein YcgR